MLVHIEGWGHAVALTGKRHNATSRKVKGLSPDEFTDSPNPSSRAMALGLTQTLRQMSTRNTNEKRFRGVERIRCARLTASLPSVSRLSRKCGILSSTQAYRLPLPVAG
jgi:hypothetical protein